MESSVFPQALFFLLETFASKAKETRRFGSTMKQLSIIDVCKNGLLTCFCHKLTYNQTGEYDYSVLNTFAHWRAFPVFCLWEWWCPQMMDTRWRRRTYCICSWPKPSSCALLWVGPIDQELPRYPSVESASGQLPPSIAQPVLPVKLNIELSKNDQRIEFGIGTTVAHVNEDACWTLERASLALYLDAFRAPVTFGFDADTLLR